MRPCLNEPQCCPAVLPENQWCTDCPSELRRMLSYAVLREVLVNSLLDVFCKLGDMPRLEVSCYFANKKRKKRKTSDRDKNKNHNLFIAEATLGKMKEYGIKGSAVTYGTIVKAIAFLQRMSLCDVVRCR